MNPTRILILVVLIAVICSNRRILIIWIGAEAKDYIVHKRKAGEFICWKIVFKTTIERIRWQWGNGWNDWNKKKKKRNKNDFWQKVGLYQFFLYYVYIKTTKSIYIYFQVSNVRNNIILRRVCKENRKINCTKSFIFSPILLLF